VIPAEDLRWLCEEWLERTGGKVFDGEILNSTGILDCRTLEQRLRIFT
jgi:hypothetical protein